MILGKTHEHILSASNYKQQHSHANPMAMILQGGAARNRFIDACLRLTQHMSIDYFSQNHHFMYILNDSSEKIMVWLAKHWK